MVIAPASTGAAILGTCSIVVGASGTLAPNPAITVLGSKQGTGAAATATITANSTLCSILSLLDCFSVSTPAPASFLSAPSGGGDTATFATTFRLNGGAELPGDVPRRVTNGTYAVQVDLTATRASGIFRSGAYQAQVTVRCE